MAWDVAKHAVFMTMFHRFWSVSSAFAPKVSITISSSKIRSRQSRDAEGSNNQNIQNCFKRTPATKKVAENKLSALFLLRILRSMWSMWTWGASRAEVLWHFQVGRQVGPSSLGWSLVYCRWPGVPSLLVWFKFVRSSGQAISRRIYEDMN